MAHISNATVGDDTVDDDGSDSNDEVTVALVLMMISNVMRGDKDLKCLQK